MIHIVGIGNEFRRDDGVGPYVAGLVQKVSSNRNIPEICFHQAGDNLVDLLEIFSPDETVILIDAVISEGAVLKKDKEMPVGLSGKSASRNDSTGEVHCYDLLNNLPAAEELRFTTHAVGPLQVARLARELGASPAKMVLYTIEGKEFGFGQEFSPAVKEAAHDVAQRIVKEIC